MDLNQLRADTPGCLHRIHLNNAGASLVPRVVTEAIHKHLSLEEQIGGYEAADLLQLEINGFYDAAARLLQVKPQNIAYTTSATDAYSRALSSIAFKKGDTILTTSNDYISNHLAFLSLQKRFGISIVQATNTPEGDTDLEDVARKLKQYNPRLVAVTHVPTNSGLVQPVAAIGQLVKNTDALYLVDACQSLGQLPVHADELQCDFLTGTFRKFLRGPRGAGLMYVSDKALGLGLEPLFIDMRGADWTGPDSYQPQPTARRFEDWEFAYALVLGSKVALEYLLTLNLQEIVQRNQHLCQLLTHQLTTIPGLTLLDKGSERSSIITFTLEGTTPGSIQHYIQEGGFNITMSYKNYALIDYNQKGVEWAVRVSPHYFNLETEIEAFAGHIRNFKRV
jgi:cysteine desulfurase / selenocysteine lyase